VAELGEQVAAAGRMWGGADYERIAQRFAPIHDDLVARLAPAPGQTWLDVGTGTGEIALRAAAAGADVTAIDISAALLEVARAKSGGERVNWELGDAQSLRFEDGSFDVVASCFAVIFAPDPEAAAHELARVCTPGGRLGLTSWRPEDGPHAVYQRFMPDDAFAVADEWGKEERVEDLLGRAFELELDEGVWHLTGESPQAVWEFMAEAVPPLKALLETLEPERAAEFRAAMLDYWTTFQTNGAVVEPRRFLIATGRRR
jgi:SAM-dependent methyltransferase